MDASTRQDGRPSMQFYPGDWRTDTAVQLSSLAARGLWIEMLCLMFQSPRRGCLLQANGKQMEAKHLAKLVGDEEANVKQILSELQANVVYSILDDGTIYSRRMLGKWKLSQSRAEAGRRGGSASKTKAKPPPSSSTPSSTALNPPLPPASGGIEGGKLSNILEKIGKAHQAAFNNPLPSRWKTAVKKKLAAGDGELLAMIDAEAMRQSKAMAKTRGLGWGIGTVLLHVEESIGNQSDGRRIVERETLRCEQCQIEIEVWKQANGEPGKAGPEPCEHLKEMGRAWFDARK